MRTARHKRALSALLGGVLACALLVGAELGLRLGGLAPTVGEFYFTQLGERILEPDMYAPHPRRFFTLKEGYRHASHHAGPNAIGTWPFRGPPLDPAPGNLWRVCVFGDSCAFGLPLPPNLALPAKLADELADGRTRAGTLVANLGVPGYSTVQIRALVEEALDEHEPHEVVIYPAAWNDQAAALNKNDLELRRESRSWLHSSALLALLRSRPEAQEHSATDAEQRGSRVPEEAVEGEVRAMIAACRERGVGVVVIAPAHPPATRETHARLWRDAESVRRAAHAEGADLVDGQVVFERSGLPVDSFFVDIAHPAPQGAAALAAAVGRILIMRAPSSGPTSSSLSIRSLTPPSVPQLGDVALIVELDGWESGAPLPTVSVGGAVLLDLESAGPHAVRGTLPTLGPGREEVIVQTSSARAEAGQGGLVVEDAAVEVLDGTARQVAARSRPGDVARVFVSTARRDVPKWSSRGALWLDEEKFVPTELTLTLGADGRAQGTLTGLADEGPYFVQALILPAGESEDSRFAIWSDLAVLP